MTFVRYLLFAVITIALAGCGKKGALIPPDGYPPPPVPAFQVEQKGKVFRLTWQMPEKSPHMAEPVGFRVLRREIRSTADECPDCGPDDLLIRTVDLEYLRDAVRIGDTFLVTDVDVQQGKTYLYRVQAFDRSGSEGSDSRRVMRRCVTPPPAPVVRISEVPAGIMLEWAPIAPRVGTLAGYQVYRLRGAERYDLKPLANVSQGETRYEDLRMEPELVYRYLVRSVTQVDGETVESEPSPEVSGKLVLP